MKVPIQDFVSEVLGKQVPNTEMAVAALVRWKIPTVVGNPDAKKLFRRVDLEFLDKAKAAYAKEQVQANRMKQKKSNGHDKPHPVTALGHKLDMISSQLSALTKWLHEREARILTTKE